MRREWTEKEVEYLKEHYGQYPVKDIAEKLKRSYESVQAKAGRIGINSNRSITANRRKWTEREGKYMESRYLYQPVEITAKRLKRSVCSVKKKAAKLGLNKFYDIFSAKQLAKCFNTDISVVLRWIEKFDMPHDSIDLNGVIHYDIDLKKFWKWTENHKDIINWSKYECGTLALEPEWVRQEKMSYEYSNTREKWTDEDLRKVKLLLKADKTYKEVAKELGRTYYGILHLMRSGVVYGKVN